MDWLLPPIDIGLTVGLVFAWAVLALALAFRLLSFPDLTVEGSFPLGAAVFAILLKTGHGTFLAVSLAMLAGAAAGASTAIIHARYKLNKFLCGIIVVAIAYSIGLRVMGKSNIGLLEFPTVFDKLRAADNLGRGVFHPGTVSFLAILAAIGILLLHLVINSRFGMRLRVSGSNPEFAWSLGLPVTIYLVIGLAATNALAAFGGVLLSMNQGFADVGMGQGVLILALASMTIGEHTLPPNKLPFHLFVIFAACVGSIIYQILAAFALRLGFASTDLKLVTAVIVLIVVAFQWSKDGENLLESGI